MATRIQRDASASIFAFGLAGVALAVHVVDSVVNHWAAEQIAVTARDRTDRAGVALVETADVPAWVVTMLHTADGVEWVGSAAVLAMLTMCVVGMLRGNVFARSTAQWATWASWAALVTLLLPTLIRIPATNTALQAAPDGLETQIVSTQWWYLYVGMMMLSFLALVLRRGSQLQQDQDGLI